MPLARVDFSAAARLTVTGQGSVGLRPTALSVSPASQPASPAPGAHVARPVARCAVWKRNLKHYDTAGSQVISLPSTDAAQFRLTSEF